MAIDRPEEPPPSHDEACDRDDVLGARLSVGCDAIILEALYDAYGASCYGLAHRMMADTQLASAIVRDVYLAMWTGETIFDPARGSVHAWLLGDTHRRAVRTLRGQRRLYDVSVASTQPEIAIITGATLGTIKTLNREALDQLRTDRNVHASRVAINKPPPASDRGSWGRR